MVLPCSSFVAPCIHTRIVKEQKRKNTKVGAGFTSQNPTALRGFDPVASVRTVSPKLHTSAWVNNASKRGQSYQGKR